jgi:hypothetical protein
MTDPRYTWNSMAGFAAIVVAVFASFCAGILVGAAI